MSVITWFDVIAACVIGVGWRIRVRLRRLEEARMWEADRREAYACEFAAETLAFDEAEMARLVKWYRTTEGTGDARPEGT